MQAPRRLPRSRHRGSLGLRGQETGASGTPEQAQACQQESLALHRELGEPMVSQADNLRELSATGRMHVSAGMLRVWIDPNRHKQTMWG
jgi:hypothetical protein